MSYSSIIYYSAAVGQHQTSIIQMIFFCEIALHFHYFFNVVSVKYKCKCESETDRENNNNYSII